MKTRLLFCLLLVASLAQAQTNVRAWYADGQVWVVWEVDFPLPETYAVYARATPFGNAADAVPVGRLFRFEYLDYALREQVDTALTWRIPNGQGGTYQLKSNEGLFVATPHQAGALYFAVVAGNATAVTPGKNGTAAAVPFQYNPAADPVECHLQATYPSPFAAGFTCFAYCMWADGRQNEWENRPDFPVMANAAKNGMPSLFLVSIPNTLDTTKPFPLTVWLHGGGGTATQSLAGSRPIINIKPGEGILLAHSDDLIGYRDTLPPHPDEPSWHFGWRKNYDPFHSGNYPTAPDTIVNYTQRRYLWIDDWLMRHFNIDPARININGHSMGSAGSTALAKCFPDHYASATLFNNGCGGPDDGPQETVFGKVSQNFPTNLTDRAGKTVGFAEIWNFIDNCAPQRDWPLIRHWHSKNDTDGTMRWDDYVVENFRTADSLGMGVQQYWSQRAHGVDTGPAYNDHWFDGNLPTQQTGYDDVDYEEAHFRSDISFPAFFNHRLDPKNNDPGDGTPGTGAAGVGDDWGTWGGYHRWDQGTIVDVPGRWSVVAWLESNAVFGNDNCPDNFLLADVAIRRPRQFLPGTGKPLNWKVTDENTGDLLQSGTVKVRPDALVAIPQVAVSRENIRRVRITVTDPTVAAGELETPGIFQAGIEPNPSAGEAFLAVMSREETPAEVSVHAPTGVSRAVSTRLTVGQNRLSLAEFGQLPAGFYVVEVRTGGQRAVARWVKL